MGSLETRLKERRAWLGASDIAAILGVSEYANAADVYYNKVAEIEGRDTKATTRGRWMERAVLDWFEAELGEQIERDVKVVCPSHPLFVAQLDGRLSSGVPVEAKTGADGKLWGDEHTDDIPSAYVVQAQTQMLCTGADICHVPALVGGFKSMDLRRYVVRRNDDLIGEIVAIGEEFWRCVEERTPPANVTPSIDTIKRIRRAPASSVVLDDVAVVAVDQYEAAKAREKAAKEAAEAAQARLLALLGEAEAGALPDGRTITYLAQNSAPSVNHKLLAANWPEAVEACVKRGTHRVLRIK